GGGGTGGRCRCSRGGGGRPRARRAPPGPGAISASIGKSAANTRGRASARPAIPPSRATVATRERSPRKSAARRTIASGAPAASAIASSTIPSDTPVRISPATMRASTSRSSGVTRATSAPSRSSRARREPTPIVAATSAKARATSGSVSGAPSGAAGAGGNHRTFRARGSVAGKARPVRKSTAGPTSSGSSVRKYSAVRRRLSRRPDVAASLRHSSANSENGRTRSLCAGEEDHHRGPRRGARERHDGPRELSTDLKAPHVLSGSKQKKGARPAIGNKVLIRRDVNHLPLLMRLGSTGGGGCSPPPASEAAEDSDDLAEDPDLALARIDDDGRHGR